MEDKYVSLHFTNPTLISFKGGILTVMLRGHIRKRPAISLAIFSQSFLPSPNSASRERWFLQQSFSGFSQPFGTKTSAGSSNLPSHFQVHFQILRKLTLFGLCLSLC
jgi:hypothetical protein